MSFLWEWLADPAHWQGSDGIWVRIVEHLGYAAITVVLAAAIGIPLGLWIGHTGKGRLVVVNLANGVRSVPTLGLLFVAVLVLGPYSAATSPSSRRRSSSWWCSPSADSGRRVRRHRECGSVGP